MLLDKLFTAVLLATLLAVLPGVTSAAEVCVQVNDTMDLPLHNAWVRATSWTDSSTTLGILPKIQNVTSDKNGQTCLNLSEGLYAIEVGLVGFLNVRYSPVRVFAARSIHLTYRLPIGDVLEGGVAMESILSGTLRQAGAVVGGATICAFRPRDQHAIGCAHSDVMGEYALAVPPGKYKVEIRTARGDVHVSEVDVSEPGFHRNRLTLGRETVQGLKK